MPQSSGNFQSFSENSDSGTAGRGVEGKVPLFVSGPGGFGSTAGVSGGFGPKTGRGGRGGFSAASARPIHSNIDAGTKTKSIASPLSGSTAASNSRQNRRGRSGKTSDGSIA